MPQEAFPGRKQQGKAVGRGRAELEERISSGGCCKAHSAEVSEPG